MLFLVYSYNWESQPGDISFDGVVEEENVTKAMQVSVADFLDWCVEEEDPITTAYTMVPQKNSYGTVYRIDLDQHEWTCMAQRIDDAPLEYQPE